MRILNSISSFNQRNREILQKINRKHKNRTWKKEKATAVIKKETIRVTDVNEKEIRSTWRRSWSNSIAFCSIRINKIKRWRYWSSIEVINKEISRCYRIVIRNEQVTWRNSALIETLKLKVLRRWGKLWLNERQVRTKNEEVQIFGWS